MKRFFTPRILLGSMLLAFGGWTSSALAESDGPVDIDARELPALRRILTLDWNPLPLFTMDRISAKVVFLPVQHAVLEVRPFHTGETSAPIYVYAGAGHPRQGPDDRFSGMGAEIAYRYQGAKSEPRGLFISPSLILGSFSSRARDGEKSRFFDLGLAADAGYETLLAAGISLSVAAGLQYVWSGEHIPEPPAAGGHAHAALAPRLLVSLDWAF